MKICVLGAGVVGVSTAFALARAGHEVHVIDQAETAGTGVSAANGAQLSYSHVDPFASPATLKQLPAYLSGFDPAVRLGLSLSSSYVSWGLKFIKECSTARSKANRLARADLALRSQRGFAVFEDECGEGLLKPTGRGKIVLTNSQASLRQMEMSALEKQALGIKTEVLSKDACIAFEPALKDWQGEWAGGLYAPQDHALDPLQYCRVLTSTAAKKYGAVFHFGETVKSLSLSGDVITGVETDKAVHDCGVAVICLGGKASTLLADLGLSAPLYPVQGYSLTLPAKAGAPKASITDQKHKVVFANLGDRLRVAGFMDTNQNSRKARKRSEQLLALAQRLWPDVADYQADPHYWTQYRPMVPSGVPVIEESRVSGLYLNIGHGALGYTFAAGSAMVIAEQIAAKTKQQPTDTKRKNYG